MPDTSGHPKHRLHHLLVEVGVPLETLALALGVFGGSSVAAATPEPIAPVAVEEVENHFDRRTDAELISEARAAVADELNRQSPLSQLSGTALSAMAGGLIVEFLQAVRKQFVDRLAKKSVDAVLGEDAEKAEQPEHPDLDSPELRDLLMQLGAIHLQQLLSSANGNVVGGSQDEVTLEHALRSAEEELGGRLAAEPLRLGSTGSRTVARTVRSRSELLVRRYAVVRPGVADVA